MQILVDIGNTRIKWAELEDGRLSNVGNSVHRNLRGHAFDSFVVAVAKRVTRLIVANVAGDEIGREFTDRVRDCFRINPDFVIVRAEQFGVRCAYADPSRLGVDRWVAVLAAHHQATGAACVIDAGTAVTFDAVDARGQHLGGLILPGPRLLASTLDRNTDAIGATQAPGVRPQGLDLLGKTTDAAVGNGAMLALTGALERAIAAVESSLEERPKVYLTGGDAGALQGWLESDVDLRRDLVLEGLALFSDAPPSAHLRPKATHA
jgi:type III pantothenate kinase